MAAAERLKDLPELTSIQAYAGTAAPFNFNGLVRHYYLREAAGAGRSARSICCRRASASARATPLRSTFASGSPTCRSRRAPSSRSSKCRPARRCSSTLLAEVYGPDEASRRAAAAKVREAFRKVDFVVDMDDTFHQPSERLRFSINQENLEFYGVDEQAVYDTIAAIIGGVKVGYSQRGYGTKPIEIDVKLPKRRRVTLGERILSTPLPAGGTARQGANVELGDVVTVKREPASYSLFRRDGRFAEMVQAEVAGRFEAPIYGMLAVEDADQEDGLGRRRPADDPLSRSAARRVRSPRCSGTANGK